MPAGVEPRTPKSVGKLWEGNPFFADSLLAEPTPSAPHQAAVPPTTPIATPSTLPRSALSEKKVVVSVG
jgi:hypothetical protein